MIVVRLTSAAERQIGGTAILTADDAPGRCLDDGRRLLRGPRIPRPSTKAGRIWGTTRPDEPERTDDLRNSWRSCSLLQQGRPIHNYGQSLRSWLRISEHEEALPIAAWCIRGARGTTHRQREQLMGTEGSTESAPRFKFTAINLFSSET
jgi:hypothetical protein